jgi:hypothetical protein
MTELELAYLAGFIDGEGSIQIGRGKWLKMRRGYALHLSAKQVDPAPLHMLAAAFGGRVIRVKATQPRRLDHYRWGIVSRQAMAALVALRPYLVVKATQADLAIWYQRTMTRGGKQVSEWAYAERDAFAEALTEVKHMAFDDAVRTGD